LVKLLSRNEALLLTCRTDPDAYLSNETLDWCQQTLLALGHSGKPSANEFLPRVRYFLVPTWFRQLRMKARAHIESGESPRLSIAPKPDTAGQWQARQQILAEMRNEVDTFGLIEGVGVIDDDQGSETTDSELAF
jgi:hypothetical protein